MALNITLTSISNIGSTHARVNFSADHHWSSWWDADAVETPADGVDSWSLSGTASNQWMSLTSLNGGTDYTVYLRGKHDSAEDEWENSSNTLEFSTTGGGGDPPGKATNPNPTNNQEDINITGIDSIKQFTWSAPSGEFPDYLVYYRVQGGTWALQETITDNSTSHTLSSTILDALSYYSIYEWRVDTRNDDGTTTGDTWTFISQRPTQYTDYTRRSDYDADKVWQPGTGWVDINTFESAGGGRYKSRVLAVGHKVIYFGDL